MVSFFFKVADKIPYFQKFPNNHSSIKVLEMFFIIRLILEKFQVVFEAHGSSLKIKYKFPQSQSLFGA